MELYSTYVKEVYGRETIHTEDYFVTYKIHKNGCYLVDMYIVPEKRNSGLAVELDKKVEDIAKSNGCNKMLTTIDIGNIKDNVLKVIKKCKYKFLKQTEFGVYFIKDI
jgi:GNAT superfamily N-acetyltransferase